MSVSHFPFNYSFHNLVSFISHAIQPYMAPLVNGLLTIELQASNQGQLSVINRVHIRVCFQNSFIFVFDVFLTHSHYSMLNMNFLNLTPIFLKPANLILHFANNSK